MYQLYLGNKNYSSWSLRPWMVASHFGVPFEEKWVSLDGSQLHKILTYSASGRVPCLHDDGFQIWDSLAIIEFLHDAYPELGIWPKSIQARARARSISAQMHSGFTALRNAMPMNIKMRLKGALLPEDIAQDVAAIDAIWTNTRTEFATDSEEPYLFGDFSAADAMFAPVVWRFFSYNIPLTPIAQSYLEAMLSNPSMKAWEASALAETDVLYDYDTKMLETWGEPR